MLNQRTKTTLLVGFVVMVALKQACLADQAVLLSELDLSKMTSGWGQPQADRSIEAKPLSIGGRTFQRGVGTHARSALWVDLKRGAKRFTALVGVDDEVGGTPASIEFQVIVDGKTAFRSGVMKAGGPAKSVDVDLTGKKTLLLLVTAGGDPISYDHADWAGATFQVVGEKPVAIDAPQEQKVILTPKPGPAPKINGPRLFGVRPGKPFICRIPATGDRPMKFAVANLPSGLRVDSSTGIITGRAPRQAWTRSCLAMPKTPSL